MLSRSSKVTRHLKKARETFDIDNTKLLKREAKIVESFEEHVDRTKNDFTQETKTRVRAQRVLEELIDERNRLWDRCEEDFYLIHDRNSGMQRFDIEDHRR